ncbi:RNA polymerase sigma factor [Sphingomonas sp. 1185]|uniref:RNA polymerase sigma factor n=1 Tax=Sphingomonas sp. 1185 TaxID=3156411 RepID=UPI003397C19A
MTCRRRQPPVTARPSTGSHDPIVDEVFRTEGPRLTRYFRSRVRGADEPVDLVQESFLRLVGRLRSGAVGNPAGYLHSIARNLLFERSRRQASKGAPPQYDQDAEIEIAVEPTQHRDMETNQMIAAYRQALSKLPPRTAEVFRLHREQDLSYKEIADRLGISARTVEWHVSEALLRIRRMMDAQ